MVTCVGIGVFTGSIFLIVLLFVAGNMEMVTTSAAGPLLQILIDATKSNAGGICLLMYVVETLILLFFYSDTSPRLPLVCLVFAIISVMTTSSRMIFAFARYLTSFPTCNAYTHPSQGWRSSCFSVFRQSPPNTQVAPQCTHSQCCGSDRIWMHLPRLYKVRITIHGR
jgi:hypothetical protein